MPIIHGILDERSRRDTFPFIMMAVRCGIVEMDKSCTKHQYGRVSEHIQSHQAMQTNLYLRSASVCPAKRMR
jgi:hypothetical protein